MQRRRLHYSLHLCALVLVLVVLVAGQGGTVRGQTTTNRIVTYPAGWNLIALPLGTNLTNADGSLTAVPPGSVDFEFFRLPLGPIAALYTWQPGYGAYGSWQTGVGPGYWAYFTAETKVILGNAGNNGPYSVTAGPGEWVMVGDPSGTQPATVTGADSILTYTQDQGYLPAALLQPGQGAWVMSRLGGTITVTPIGHVRVGS